MRPILNYIIPRESLLTHYSIGMSKMYPDGFTLDNAAKCINCHYKTLISTVHMFDSFTGVHLRSAEKIAAHIAMEMKLPIDDVIGVTLGSVLHDIGKVGINYSIITKPGPLTIAERVEIEDHPTIGKRILDNLHTPWGLADYAYMHHERLDGTGYPQKLTEDKIPLTIRILSVADVIDAMTADRPYRAGLPFSKSFDYLYSCASQFDVDVIRAAETYNPEAYKNIE